MMLRACERNFSCGVMSESMTMAPLLLSILATSAVRRMFSFLSLSEKLKSALSPLLRLSPSRMMEYFCFLWR